MSRTSPIVPSTLFDMLFLAVRDGCSWVELVTAAQGTVYPLMPTTANRLSALTGSVDRERAARHARSVRPIITAATLALLDEFIRIKRNPLITTFPERRLYGSDRYKPDDDGKEDGGKNRRAVAALVHRLLRDRPLVFMNPEDFYVLRDNAGRGTGGFDAVGTDEETHPLTLDRTLSYDEMALAALMGVAVPTDFINRGGRFNKAVAERPVSEGGSDFTREGVYVALVGARFERRGVMEAAHMLVDPEVNTVANGYGPPSSSSTAADSPLLRAWARAYRAPGGYLPTWEEAAKEAEANEGRGRFMSVKPLRTGPPGLGPVNDRKVFLDTVIYTERIAVCADILLTEAEARGAEARAAMGSGVNVGDKVSQIGAYVHVVGLGLGVWQVCTEQQELSLDAWVRAIRTRLSLPHVTDVDFSWWGPYSEDPPEKIHSWKGVATTGVLTGQPGTPAEGNRVSVHFSKRDPADSIPSGKVLVASYAWDGNAYPGNEYWDGALTASGDPAAACCSHVCELQNPSVNPTLGDPEGVAKGVATSLHVAKGDGSLASLSSLDSTWCEVEQRRFASSQLYIRGGGAEGTGGAAGAGGANRDGRDA